jgi:PEGA domain
VCFRVGYAATLMPTQRSCFAFAAFVALLLPSVSRAQQPASTPSDSDRAAARELAMQGAQLQQAGNCAEAVDRFARAEAIFPAPTNLLHEAQCEAVLGKLVEAAEHYRLVVRTPLPAGSPNAFVQAQQQAATELAQVEPRIPSIRIIVRPRAPQGTTIKIDEQEVSPAYVGVERPTDPGAHSVVLQAPGYVVARQRVTLQEKETKDVAFNLGAPGYYAPPAPTPAPTYAQPPPPAPTPSQTFTSQPIIPLPPQHEQANGGFMIGGTVGLLIPAGNAEHLPGNAGQEVSMGSLAGPGVALSLDGGFRFVKRLYIGLTYQHAFLSAGSALTGTAFGGTANADSNYVGIDLAVFSDPDYTAFYARVGAGYRYLDLGVTNSNTPSATFGETLSGGEGSVGVGVALKLGSWVRLIPEASVNIGSFSSVNLSGTSPLGDTTGGVANSDTHVFVLLGLTAFIDFARKN